MRTDTEGDTPVTDALCDSFLKTLDKLAAERAIADRLAEELEKLAWLAGHEVPNEAEKALAAWKEARSE